ncbi:MAG: NfeD family protein [Actinomycetota bacterium]|nr:NfeD family protein [Actinomycetota bacterium]
MPDRSQVVAEIERYWLETGIGPTTVAEMRAELEGHLLDAEADGKSVEDVVGDKAQFAENWATAHRGRAVASWRDVQVGNTKKERDTRRDTILYGLGTAALIAAAAVAGQGGSDVDNEVWRWMWTIFAIVMGVGEVLTAGFFLLPFAIGAAAAAILAWFNAALLAQWLVFFGVSVFALAYLRRYIGRQDEGEQPRVGANRWVGAEGLVLQEIDPRTGAGMVRILNEEWRATADQPIATGARIVVTDVKGTRLFVEQLGS